MFSAKRPPNDLGKSPIYRAKIGIPLLDDDGWAVLLHAMAIRPQDSALIYYDFGTGIMEYNIDCNDLPHYDLLHDDWKALCRQIEDMMNSAKAKLESL